jgi:hypothetical protein
MNSGYSFLNDLAHAELTHPVPRADGVAQSTLKAKPEGFPASFLDLFDYLFKGGDCFHGIRSTSEIRRLI